MIYLLIKQTLQLNILVLENILKKVYDKLNPVKILDY